jgi:transcriptional regulator of acetoin/glycerol metabolism
MFRRALAGRLESAVVHSDGGLRFEARFQAARAGSVLARLREGVQRIHALASSAVPAGSSVTADPGDGVLDPVAGHVLHVARRAFERDIPVLINGETGTGKECWPAACMRTAAAREARLWPSTAHPCRPD